jgi:hypothetical protein
MFPGSKIVNISFPRCSKEISPLVKLLCVASMAESALSMGTPQQ